MPHGENELEGEYAIGRIKNPALGRGSFSTVKPRSPFEGKPAWEANHHQERPWRRGLPGFAEDDPSQAEQEYNAEGARPLLVGFARTDFSMLGHSQGMPALRAGRRLVGDRSPTFRTFNQHFCSPFAAFIRAYFAACLQRLLQYRALSSDAVNPCPHWAQV